MSNYARRPRRMLAGMLAGALALSVTPILGFTGVASAADPLPPVADPIGEGNVCEGAPATEPFTDVTEADPSFEEIICLVAAGLTQGTTPTTYSPNGTITRRQMSAFIKRLVDLANAQETEGTDLQDLPAYDNTVDYPDVNAEDTEFQVAIGQLTQAGIVEGFPDGGFHPGDPVSRRQMAAFINRAFEFLTGAALSDAGDYFDDDNTEPQEVQDNFNGLAAAGIFQGDGAGSVFPGSALSRRQMANILLRALEVMFEDGAIERLFEPAAPDEDLSFSPGLLEPDVNFVSTGPGDNTGRHQYTLMIADPEAIPMVDLIVIPAGAVNINDAFEVSFEDDNGDDRADFVDDTIPALNTTAVIEAINNVNPVGGATPYINNQSTAGGELTIDIDSQFPADAVFVLAFQDTNNDNRLTVDGDNLATEAFAISGLKAWTNCESEFESDFTADSVIVGGNPLAQLFDLFSASTGNPACTEPFGGLGTRYEYDDNDIFRIEGVQVTKAEFEAALSAGDDVDVLYNPAPAGVSEFDIFLDLGHTAPVNLAAAATNLDAGPSGNDVVLTFNTPPTNSGGAQYVVQRRSTAGGDGICGTADDGPGPWSDLTTLSLDTFAGEDPGDQITYPDMNVPDGCYDYQVVVTDPVTDEVRTSNVASVNVPAPPDLADPNVLFAIIDDNTAPNQLSAGDVIDIIFDEEVLAEAGDEVQIADADGEFTSIVLGTGNTFTVTHRGTPGMRQTQLKIVLDGAPAVAGDNDFDIANNDGVLDWTFVDFLQITGATGIEDLAGNDWDPFFDVIFEDETGPNIVVAQGTEGDTVIDVWFDEAVDPVSAGNPANYRVDNDGVFGDNAGANPVVSVSMNNGSAGYPGLIDGWTRVTIRTTLPINPNTVVSQTVADKLGNSGDFDTLAAPEPVANLGLIVLNPATGTTGEDGTDDTVTVTLTEQVTQNVTVTLSTDDPTEGVVDDTAGADVLTFTPANWNIPQQVTVEGQDDPVEDGDVDYNVVANAVSSDPLYNGATAMASMTNVDDEVAALVVSPTTVNVTETGPNGSFDVSLSEQPTSNVTVTVSNPSPADYTVSPTTLVFTPANYATPQTVTVDPINDPTCETDPESFATVVSVQDSSSADEYDAVPNVNVTVNVSGPEDVCGAPFMTDAIINVGTNTVTAVYNEDVNCQGGTVAVANNFGYVDTANSALTDDPAANNIAQASPNSCTIFFDGLGANFSIADAGNLTYTSGGGGPGVDICDVDPDVNCSPVSEVEPASIAGSPTITGIQVDPATNGITVFFDEPVLCTTVDTVSPFDEDFTATRNATGIAFTSATCAGPNSLAIILQSNADLLVGDDVDLSVIAGALTDNRGNANVGGSATENPVA